MNDIEIFYKVVEKGTRHCSNWTIFKLWKRYKSNPRKWNEFRRKYNHFFPRYLKGSIIKCAENSLGLMVFRRFSDARDFELYTGLFRAKTIIIKVEVQKRNILEHQLNIIDFVGDDPEMILDYEGSIKKSSIEGTVFVKELKVLE